jgi:hypothetical protein
LNENGDKILVGSLKLEEFANLEVLNVSNNQLTSLDVSNLTNLRELNCSDNELMIINLPPHSILNSAEENSEKKLLTLIMKNSKNSRKRKKYNYLEILDCSNNLLENCNFLDNLKEAYHLESLNIGSNNFSELDIGKIKILKRLINLKFLNIGNDNVGKLEKGICNRFHGSLKSLENLPELEGLGISYTNIDSGLEYLPESIKMIGAAHRENIDKVKKIFQELENFEMNYQK